LGCSTAKKQQRAPHPPSSSSGGTHPLPHNKSRLLFAYQSTLVVTGGCRQTGIKISKAAAPRRAIILATLIARKNAPPMTPQGASAARAGGHSARYVRKLLVSRLLAHQSNLVQI